MNKTDPKGHYSTEKSISNTNIPPFAMLFIYHNAVNVAFIMIGCFLTRSCRARGQASSFVQRNVLGVPVQGTLSFVCYIISFFGYTQTAPISGANIAVVLTSCAYFIIGCIT